MYFFIYFPPVTEGFFGFFFRVFDYFLGVRLWVLKSRV